MLFNIIYTTAVVFGVSLSVFAGFIMGINNQKQVTAKEAARWAKMISRAMSDAYSAGYTDGKFAGKPRAKSVK